VHRPSGWGRGAARLDALPSLVERVYAVWSLTGGEPQPGGVGSWVARVGSPSGSAVLEVARAGFPDRSRLFFDAAQRLLG
jgi:hypothetical protein